jgi:HAD superfamily hydrolase (TIGR01549 family)
MRDDGNVATDCKVVAFDCDGVMFDSKEANRAYYDNLLTHFNLPPMAPDVLAYAHMHTVDEVMASLFPDPSTLEAAHRYRIKIGYLPFLKYMEMEPDLISLLERLRPRIITGVVTNRTDTMGHVLSENHIDHLFDFVVTAMDVDSPKPDPEGLNKVAYRFSIHPAEMIYVGDSKVDEMASRAAGVSFVAYRNSDLTADYHIQRLAEMNDILGL